MQLKLDLPKADKNQFGSRLAYLESFTEAGIASENFVYDHYNKSVCKSQEELHIFPVHCICSFSTSCSPLHLGHHIFLLQNIFSYI
jgi:hypothetical protein